jgi:MFS family permease
MIGEAGDLAHGTSNRPFAGLLSAAFISVFGTAMSALAIPWLVLSQTGSPGKTGLVSFAELAPYVALQALGGPVVDRVGAGRASLFGNVAAAIAVSAIPAFYAAGLLGLGTLVPLVSLAGASRGIADCGNIVLLPATAALGGVPIQRAAGLFSSVSSAALLLGAPLAGVLAASAGPATVILADGIAFAVAALLRAVFIPSGAENAHTGSGTADPARPGSRRGFRGYLEDLSEGLRFLRSDRLLLAIAVMVAATNLLDQGLFAVLLPVWVRDHSYSPAALGLLTGVLSAGMLLGALAASWLGPRLPRRLVYSVGFLLSGAPSFAMLAISRTVLPVALVFVACGIAGGAINPILGAVQYERVPARHQARVLGAVKASAWVGMPFGPALAGGLATTVGLRAALMAGASVFLVLTLTPFFFPAWRQLNNAETPRAEVHAHGNGA